MAIFSTKPYLKIVCSSIIYLFFLAAQTNLAAQTEADFYTPPTKMALTQNLVSDYGVDNDFTTDDSKQLQKAINTISKKGGGKLIIPKGNYSFLDISMQSDVHIEFDSEVVIRPSAKAPKRNLSIFRFGSEDGIRNVSFTSNDIKKNYTIDLTQTDHTRVTVFALRDVNNFLFSNATINDNQTVFSSFTLGVTAKGPKHNYPRNGVIKNSSTTNADYGYGLIQSQAAKNVFFHDLGGQGGVTLRLETGEKKMNNLQIGGNHDLFAKDIECHDGNAAVMISPHAMQCGIVTVDGVTAVNCGFAVRIGGAYVAKKYKQDIGLKPGAYDSRSSVKNVTATFGTTAQVKPKHFMYIPLDFQTEEYTADTPITNTFSNPRDTKSKESRVSVSVAAVAYMTGHKVVCTSKDGKIKKKESVYTINVDKSTVKAIGFTNQRPVIDVTDDVYSDCKCVK